MLKELIKSVNKICFITWYQLKFSLTFFCINFFLKCQEIFLLYVKRWYNLVKTSFQIKSNLSEAIFWTLLKPVGHRVWPGPLDLLVVGAATMVTVDHVGGWNYPVEHMGRGLLYFVAVWSSWPLLSSFKWWLNVVFH